MSVVSQFISAPGNLGALMPIVKEVIRNNDFDKQYCEYRVWESANKIMVDIEDGADELEKNLLKLDLVYEQLLEKLGDSREWGVVGRQFCEKFAVKLNNLVDEYRDGFNGGRELEFGELITDKVNERWTQFLDGLPELPYWDTRRHFDAESVMESVVEEVIEQVYDDSVDYTYEIFELYQDEIEEIIQDDYSDEIFELLDEYIEW